MNKGRIKVGDWEMKKRFVKGGMSLEEMKE